MTEKECVKLGRCAAVKFTRGSAEGLFTCAVIEAAKEMGLIEKSEVEKAVEDYNVFYKERVERYSILELNTIMEFKIKADRAIKLQSEEIARLKDGE